MKRVWCLAMMLFAGSLSVPAGEDDLGLPDLMQNAQQWAQENLDTNVLNALPEVDNPQVQQFFRDVQQRFQGEYVVDIAPLKQAAAVILPFLDNDEQLQPYAAWLKAQMDYLDVADTFRVTVLPPDVSTNQVPGTVTNQPPPLVSNPSPQVEREIWIKKVAARPWPAGAREYVPQLKPIFTAQEVPAQLVWLAEVESAFDRRAESPAGAAGLFQLMPDTAKRFGLSLWPRDQRCQPGPSATASAQYLKFLYGKFKDWRLALAAYNAGEGRVQRLLDRYHTHSYDDIAMHLPAETQMYVPRIEAVVQLREGVKLEEL